MNVCEGELTRVQIDVNLAAHSQRFYKCRISSNFLLHTQWDCCHGMISKAEADGDALNLVHS